MYREEDKVRVFNQKGLYTEVFEIVEMDDEEESFTVKGKDDEGQDVTLTVPRSHIMEEWETDKLTELFVESRTFELDDASENEYIQADAEGDGNDAVTVYSDVTLSGIASHFSGNFSTVTEAETWLKEAFSHYSENGLYKTPEAYYAVLVG